MPNLSIPPSPTVNSQIGSASVPRGGRTRKEAWLTGQDEAGKDRARAGEFPFPVHPHMLRHACGYKLANDGQDTRAVQHYLGHKNIQHTVRYTELSPERFKSFWED